MRRERDLPPVVLVEHELAVRRLGERLARVLAVLDRMRAVMDEGALPDAVGGEEAPRTVANPFE